MAMRVPASRPQPGPHQAPIPTTSARATPPKMSPSGNMKAKYLAVRRSASYWRSMAPCTRSRTRPVMP